ncbi:serine/threonine-protein kinase [Patescibacteria group bacterium]|nr:serine/threonine-protein kinase [Patescibacteria group bacterium]MBU1722080.1 serine/threonine-protein kinase [Patescibacteria group bacterium]MBU1901360.1 serine/threonine-protein kinase [Patescibacteria group bacterium]
MRSPELVGRFDINPEVEVVKSIDLIELIDQGIDIKELLLGAQKQKKIGKGAQAVVWLMEATYGDHKLPFVRKTFTQARESDIQFEYGVLDRLKGISGIPRVYWHDEKSIDMEYLTGIPLGRMKKTQRDMIPDRSIISFRDSVIKSIARGVINTDFNVNNILWNAESMKLEWIDFGGVRMINPKDMTRTDIKSVFDALRKTFPYIDLSNAYEQVYILLNQ